MSRHDERHEQTLSGRGTAMRPASEKATRITINSLFARYKINESPDPDTLVINHEQVIL